MDNQAKGRTIKEGKAILIGIDVGGTFTDGVLFHEGKVVSSDKRLTDQDNLKISLLQVLDKLLDTAGKEPIERIVLSTTLVTNLLATGNIERTALILIPGFGLPRHTFKICRDTYYLSGGIDFRGRVVEDLDRAQIESTLKQIYELGIRRIAVAGKFANRNGVHEKTVEQVANELYPDLQVLLSCKISGKLNYPRRAATTYYTAAVAEEWNQFTSAIKEAIKERGINTDIHILKADGGTMPLDMSLIRPCETVFSGPAASTMGAVALTMDESNSVVIDIGGTTTDISLIVGGMPLYASRGACLEGKLTHVSAFAVKSIPLGGDSMLSWKEQQLRIGPERRDSAACFGGKAPTVIDAFNVHYRLQIGDFNLSINKLAELADGTPLTQEEIASQAVEMVYEQVAITIRNMFKEWENEPAYKVWEVINRRKYTLDRIIGIGAAAHTIIPGLAEKMQLDYLVHEYSPVANALGAAAVRPTLSVELHIDTQKQTAMVDPGGINVPIKNAHRYQLTDAKNLALEYLKEFGKENDVEPQDLEPEFYTEEQFNVIRGWDTVGKLFEIGVQVKPGFIKSFKGVRI
jgi:N-methylhydantoinase A